MVLPLESGGGGRYEEHSSVRKWKLDGVPEPHSRMKLERTEAGETGGEHQW